MADNRIEVAVHAETGELEAALAHASEMARDAFAAIVASAREMGTPLQGVVSGIAAIGPASAGARNQVASAKEEMRLLNHELQAGMQHIRTLAQLHQIGAAEEEAAETRLTTALFQEQLKRADAEIAVQQQGTKAFQDAVDRKIEIQQKFAAALQRIEDQAALRAQREWLQTLRPIENAVDTMFRNMLTSSKSFGQSMQQIAGNLVTSFISARVKIEFEWLAGQLAMALGSQKWAEQSLLQWVTAALGITSAQKTQEALQVAGKGAAAAATGAITTSQSTGEILAAAAVAAANAYAATAAIPIVGPELAPEAAAAAYTATAAWAAQVQAAANIAGGAAGLAVGAWEIPSTMLAILHAGETVVPADFASGLRSSGVLGGGGTAATGDTFSITVQAIDTQTGAQFLKNNAAVIAQTLAGQKRNASRALAGVR